MRVHELRVSENISITASTRLSATRTTLLLRSVPVRVLEGIYEDGTGLKACAVLCARGYLVSLPRLVGCGLVVHRQVQPPGEHYTPLPAVGVRRHLDLLDGAEEDHLAMRARYQATFDPRDRYIHLGHVLHPGRIWVHESSFPHVFAHRGSCVILHIEGIVTGAANERQWPLPRPCLAPRLGSPARYMEKILVQFPRSKSQQLATNPGNIRYHTPRYGSVYAPYTPLIHSARGVG